jgi:tetratricopeptide (TPR) repeat protein
MGRLRESAGRSAGAALLLLALWLLPARSAAQPAEANEARLQAQLLDGVRAFRAEQYESALEIFRRVEGAASRPDIGFYLGMALHKLGRHAEALSEFRAAHRSGLREPVADYYRAVSCYRMGLYERARAGFRALLQPPASDPAGAPQLGPRLLQGAERFLAALDRATATPGEGAAPDPGQRLEGALQKADAASARSDAEAQEWLEEAALLLGALPAAERAAALPKFQAVLARVQQAARGPAAPVRTSELGALLQRVSVGSLR